MSPELGLGQGGDRPLSCVRIRGHGLARGRPTGTVIRALARSQCLSELCFCHPLCDLRQVSQPLCASAFLSATWDRNSVHLVERI